MITILILIIISAITSAVGDIISHKYGWSIFAKYYNIFNGQFWDPIVSWKNKYIDGDPKKGRKQIYGINIHPAFLDGWHLMKSIRIICFISAITLALNLEIKLLFNSLFITWLIYTIILGTIWNLTFSLFYNKLLKA